MTYPGYNILSYAGILNFSTRLDTFKLAARQRKWKLPTPKLPVTDLRSRISAAVQVGEVLKSQKLSCAQILIIEYYEIKNRAQML